MPRVTGQKDRRELTILSSLGRRLGQQPVAILSFPRVRTVCPALPDRVLSLPRSSFLSSPHCPIWQWVVFTPFRPHPGEAAGSPSPFFRTGFVELSRHPRRSAGCMVTSRSAHTRHSLVPRGPSKAAPGLLGADLALQKTQLLLLLLFSCSSLSSASPPHTPEEPQPRH